MMNRRSALKGVVLSAAGIGIAPAIAACKTTKIEENSATIPNKLLGNIKHSACRWCYQGMSLEQLTEEAKEIGLKSIELLNPNEWDTVLSRGLECAISFGSSLGIPKGFNDIKNHEQLYNDYKTLLPLAAEKGIKQVICFSGNRNGISDEQGLENCAIGLDKVAKIAQKYNVKLVMELLNSKVNHPDYQCDHTAWGVALAEKLGNPNFTLLYDIYHMQIMEGDVIATIQKYHKYISHYHTGGVPGRNEINETQELNYKAIINAIKATGYNDYVAQEFIPTRPSLMESLKEGVLICDI